MNMIQKLRELHGDVAEPKDGFKVVDAWALAGRLMSRLPLDQGEVSRIVDARDADGFGALIELLERPPEQPESQGPTFAKREYDSAMAAFKKRLHVVRLNDESRLGGRYTSGGHRSGIDAVEPPHGHDGKIWKALVREGRLVNAGQGMYALAPGEPR